MDDLDKYKTVCKECGHHCKWGELLRAPNPFDPEESVTGCPNCFAVDASITVCDVEGCFEVASCGWPSKSGYRHTCGKHLRNED